MVYFCFLATWICGCRWMMIDCGESGGDILVWTAKHCNNFILDISVLNLLETTQKSLRKKVCEFSSLQRNICQNDKTTKGKSHKSGRLRTNIIFSGLIETNFNTGEISCQIYIRQCPTKTTAAIGFFSSSTLESATPRLIKYSLSLSSHTLLTPSFPLPKCNFSNNSPNIAKKPKRTTVTSATTTMTASFKPEEARVPPVVPLPTPPLTKVSLNSLSLSLSLHIHTRTHIQFL